MIHLDLFRKRIANGYTIGDLLINGEFFCETLENTVRDLNKNGIFDGSEKKVWGESAIPYGEFKVKVTYSPRFKRNLPRVFDVPHFEGILFHRGNSSKDTEGCILLGIWDGKGDWVHTSTPFEKKLVEILGNEEAILNIY